MIKRYFRPRFLISLVIVIGLGYLLSGLPAHIRSHSTPLLRWVEDDPSWMRSSTCVAPNDADRRKVELALGVARAVFGYFGTTEMRKEDSKYVRICPNDVAQDEFARLTSKTPYWRVGGFPGDHDIDHLRVARNVGPRLPEIVEIVAETAFAKNPIGDQSSLPRDIRPLARVILAEFGGAAMPWSDQAFETMGSGDELGTTAAQIAVVTHHPGALEKTAALLDDILKAYPRDPIPDYVWMRFYELAFALAAAGPDAMPFIDPVVRMTCRTVDVWAPPFGWLSLSPNEMFDVLKIVGVDPCRAPSSTTNARP